MSSTESLKLLANDRNNSIDIKPFYSTEYKPKLISSPLAMSLSTTTSCSTTATAKRMSDESETNSHFIDFNVSNNSEKQLIKQELNPLFKRIKKEHNNSLLIDSNQCFIKQEFETEFDFNTRQPIVNLFSQLSIERAQSERSGIPVPQILHSTTRQLLSNSWTANSSSGSSQELQSNSYQNNSSTDLSEDLKQLTIDLNESYEKLKKNKKKKNKKSKKAKNDRKPKINSDLNVFKKFGKSVKNNNKKKYLSKVNDLINNNQNVCNNSNNNLFRVKSSVIKELKVSAIGGLSATEVQALMDLRNEGIVRKVRKNYNLFKCLLCCQRFDGKELAEAHVRSDGHLEQKSEQNLRKLDSRLAIDIGVNTDIEVLLARRRRLSELSNKVKEQLYSRGIRLNKGFGSNAWVCLECNEQPLESLEHVFQHLDYKQKLYNSFNNSLTISESKADLKQEVIDLNTNTKFETKLFKTVFNIKDNDSVTNLTTDEKERLFKDEGIVWKIHKNSRKKKLKLFCNFCTKYWSTEEQAYSHIQTSEHIKATRGQSFSRKSIAAKLCVESEREDDLKVVFARNSALKHWSKEEKQQLLDEGIRLKDGIGAEAYLCQKCGQTLMCGESYKSGLDVVNKHLLSDYHLNQQKNQEFKSNNS